MNRQVRCTPVKCVGSCESVFSVRLSVGEFENEKHTRSKLLDESCGLEAPESPNTRFVDSFELR